MLVGTVARRWRASRIVLPTAGCLLLATVIACSEGPALVGSLEVQPATIELPYPGTADIDLRFVPFDGAEAPGPGSTVFLHLLNEQGDILRTFDHGLPGAWRQGEEVNYPVRLYQSALAPGLPPGTYRLTAGLVDADGERRGLDVVGRDLGRGEYEIATVEVREAGGTVPELTFQGEWEELESGTDRQILARRWLTGTASLAVRVAEPGGRLWLRLRLPPLGDPGSSLVLLEGAESPRVRIHSVLCGGLDRILEGGAPLDLEFPLDLAGQISREGRKDVRCLIQLEPNFYLVKEGSFERRVASLELVSRLPEDG